MPTEDAYSSGHLVLSHFGTCMCSNVETNLSWTCLVSGLLNFEHPSVLLFCLSVGLVWQSKFYLYAVSFYKYFISFRLGNNRYHDILDIRNIRWKGENIKRLVSETYCSIFVLLWLCIVCRLWVFVIRHTTASDLSPDLWIKIYSQYIRLR